MSLNHLTMAMSLVAMVLSSFALYRSSDNYDRTQANRPDIGSLTGIDSPDVGDAHEPSGRATTDLETNLAPNTTTAIPQDHAEMSRDSWHITYRGAEEVVNIGEPLDVELTQLDSEDTEKVIQVGADLRVD